MAKKNETRVERCPFGKEQKYAEFFQKFGWTVASKRYVTQNGMVLPLGARIDKSYLNVSFCDITFTRLVDEENLIRLNNLQNEYESTSIQKEKFSTHLIVICIVLGIFVIGFSALSILARGYLYGIMALLICAALCAIPIPIIILLELSRIKKAKALNAITRDRREEILKEVRKYI